MKPGLSWKRKLFLRELFAFDDGLFLDDLDVLFVNGVDLVMLMTDFEFGDDFAMLFLVKLVEEAEEDEARDKADGKDNKDPDADDTEGIRSDGGAEIFDPCSKGFFGDGARIEFAFGGGDAIDDRHDAGG